MKTTKTTMLVDLFKTSIIVQSLVTLLLLCTICVLWLAPVIRPELADTLKVPDALYVVVGTVLGYWFKTKDKFNAQQAQQELLVALSSPVVGVEAEVNYPVAS